MDGLTSLFRALDRAIRVWDMHVVWVARVGNGAASSTGASTSKTQRTGRTTSFPVLVPETSCF